MLAYMPYSDNCTRVLLASKQALHWLMLKEPSVRIVPACEVPGVTRISAVLNLGSQGSSAFLLLHDPQDISLVVQINLKSNLIALVVSAILVSPGVQDISPSDPGVGLERRRRRTAAVRRQVDLKEVATWTHPSAQCQGSPAWRVYGVQVISTSESAKSCSSSPRLPTAGQRPLTQT